MRIAVLSDIHGNLPALDAVFRKLEELDFDTIISLGDQVGYGPFANEVIDVLRAKKIETVVGNHDAGACGRISLAMFREPNHSLLKWTSEHLTPENRQYLFDAPYVMRGEQWCAAHASPLNPQRWTYLNNAALCREVLEGIEETFCLVGHTHKAGVVADRIGVMRVRAGARFVINPGSVGQPRDGTRLASFGILDTQECTWEPHQVSWSWPEVLERFREIGVDERTARRLLLA